MACPLMIRKRRSVIQDDEIKYLINLNLRAGVKHMTEYVLQEEHYICERLTNYKQARFGILKMLLDADPNLLKISQHQIDNKPDLTVHLSRSLLRSVAHKAVSDLALHLHIYKSTADVTNGSVYFESLTALDEQSLAWRDAVMAQKKPRPLFVMGNIFLDGDLVLYKDYPATREGLIQSWVERNV